MLRPVVQRAMETLSSQINTKTGLNDPDDHAAAVSLLESLHSAGETFEPEGLAAWASLNGWTSKGVAQIRLAANDVLSGKRHQHTPPVWQSGLVEKLRSDGGDPGIDPRP